MVPALPTSAPFTAAQRAWLNGYFAAILGSELPSAPAASPAPAAEEEAAPWHDPALPMAERLELARNKPLPRQLMAAMAQLDCGACGYLCKTYGEAIASGAEKNINLCAPGGAATARKLKELIRAAPVNTAVAASPAPGAAAPRTGPDRHQPFPARLVKATRLNGEESEKDTRHVVIDLEGSGIVYEPGDSLGVWPENCPVLVESILSKLGFSGDEPVPTANGAKKPLREALLKDLTITAVSDELVALLQDQSAATAADATTGLDVLDLLERSSAHKLSPAQIVECLAPLTPRLYSISSSLKAHPDEVHLTVAVVRYTAGERQRRGVASGFLAERVKAGQRVPVFVQASHGFRLPVDPNTPIIMIGPGTGIAPFRAFLQERQETAARGRNWLFFGDQRRQLDYLYRSELEAFERGGYLHRLELAFSRDQAEKVYVQDRLRASAGELWRWLEAGAVIYVCGDAKRMARDVDRALQEIIASQGGLSPEGARARLEELKASQRYLRDVY